MKAVCVFCGATAGKRPLYAASADALGRLLAERRIDLVYGGSNVGMMGTIADAAIRFGGRVHGFMPEFLAAREIAHPELTRLEIVSSMHERKARMADRADAFIALPGGYGTLDEFCEILTWAQLRLHAKPIGLLNVHGYFDLLLRFFDHAVEEGFLSPALRTLIVADADPSRLLDLLIRSADTRPGADDHSSPVR